MFIKDPTRVMTGRRAVPVGDHGPVRPVPAAVREPATGGGDLDWP
jgi:hypothetical protein